MIRKILGIILLTSGFATQSHGADYTYVFQSPFYRPVMTQSHIVTIEEVDALPPRRELPSIRAKRYDHVHKLSPIGGVDEEELWQKIKQEIKIKEQYEKILKKHRKKDHPEWKTVQVETRLK